MSDINTIYKISHTALMHKGSISSLIHDVFKTLQKEMNFERGALTLKRDNNLTIEASIGLTPEEKNRGRYKVGEGITGKVGQTGKSIIIPDISEEPGFLGKTKIRRMEKTAFICVPVTHDSELIGTLSIETQSDSYEMLSNKMKVIEIIANITADGINALRNEIDEREQLEAENIRLRSELGSQYKPENIIGSCDSMKVVYNMIHQVAESQATVLIRGESGTGKELIAKAIHYASPRKKQPFIAVNCAALPEGLVESELFGHEKGSFTGANEQRKGRFEIADGGTLFLDEIGDISIPVQVKMLRALQEKSFYRIGGSAIVKSDVRVIAATSRNLEEQMRKGKFREDLYYRLNVFPIYVPPLRERGNDIIQLSCHLVDKYNRFYTKNIKSISTKAMNMLMSYHWPGNVRELENCIERSMIVADSDVIESHHLPPSLQTGVESKTSLLFDDSGGFKNMVMTFEKELIIDALKFNRGNIAETARKLKTTQRILHYKITKLGIDSWKYL